MAATLGLNESGDRDLEALVRRAQDGDHSAFERVYRLLAGRVYGLCLRLGADPGWAEELTQSVFVRVWEKLSSYRGDGKFFHWVRRLAVNVVLEERRAESRRTQRVFATDDATLLDGVSREEEPGVGIDLERAIAGLPEGARTVLVLHDVEGYRHDEIAALTGMATGSSKAQLHRARRLLREALER